MRAEPSTKLPFFKIIIIVAQISGKRFFFQIQNPAGGTVDKITVMGNVKYGSFIGI